MEKCVLLCKKALLMLLIAISSSAYAQKKVTGVVSDGMTNEPLAGVNVIIEGTTQGIITDADGKYSLDVPTSEATLIFSFIGYNTEKILVGNQTIISVNLLPDIQKLDEVVVVGYGTQSRAKLTTAITKLDTKVLDKAAMANAGQALQGTVPGLRVVANSGQPGAALTITLRGGATLTNPGGPLIIVDGIARSLNDVNPSDIESLQVLKDAASTAIYGARANSGVILITTKQAKKGVSEVTYKFKTGINKRRDSYNYVGARDYLYYNRLGVKYTNSARQMGGVGPVNPNTQNGYGTSGANQKIFSLAPINGTNRSQFQSLLNEGWEWMVDPYTDVDTLLFKDYNGQVGDDAFNNNAVTQDHYISFIGGNENGKFASSLGYYSEDGLVIGTKYERLSGTLNGSYKIKRNLEISSAISFTNSKRPPLYASESQLFYRIMSLWPTFKPYDDEGQPSSGNGITDGNPLYWQNKYLRKNNTRRTTLNIGAKWEIINDLTLRAQANAYYIDYTNEGFNKKTLRQTSSTPDITRLTFAEYEKTFQQQHNITLDYLKTINNHTISILVGGEYLNNSVFDLYGEGQRAPTDDVYTLNAAVERTKISSEKTQYNIISGFGRLNYDYSGKYLLTIVTRYDGISRLKDNRWGFFPGFSVGWNIHKEEFFTNSRFNKVITTLKPRVSYGINGNVAGLSNFEVQGLYGIQTLYSDRPGFLNTGIVNKTLKWEKSKSLEVGTDIGLFNDKITIVADYYQRNTTDLLTNLALPGYTGFGTYRTNLGTLTNNGFETEITANILKNKRGFSWNVSFNTSFVKNKIVKLPDNGIENNRQGGIQVYDPSSKKVIWVAAGPNSYMEGSELGEIYGYRQLRILKDADDVNNTVANRYDKIAEIYGPNLYNTLTNKNGKYMIEPGDVLWDDIDKNDTIDFRDRVRLGNYLPKWTGGFSSTFSYKNVSLYARFEYALGHTIYNDVAARIMGQYQGTFNIIDWVKDSWTPTNNSADLPKFYYADQLAKKNITRENNSGAILNGNSSRFYEKGDYLAIKELTLSYDFPKSLLSKIRLSSVQIYGTCQNLKYFTKYSGAIPEPVEINDPNNSDPRGVDIGRYPVPKTYLVGLQISF